MLDIIQTNTKFIHKDGTIELNLKYLELINQVIFY